MTLGELYKKVVDMGIAADPRSREDLKRFLKRKREEFKKFKTKEEKAVYQDRLWNPYDDTRVIYGDSKHHISVAFVGIDIGIEDLLLVQHLNEKRKKERKKPIDLVMSHHPEGYALGGLSEVMDDIHVEVLRQAGVPVNITEKILASRIRDVSLSVNSLNLHRTYEAAKLLGVPMICCHTVGDNNAYQTIKQVIEKAKPYYLKDIVEVLKKIPAYQKAALLFDRPVDIVVGSPASRTGKIVIGGFTGGTEGNPEILEYAVNVAGIGTTIDMHLSPKHRELAEKWKLNCIVANHMASDSIGMQHIVNMMREKGIEVVVGAGYIDAPLP